jgi:hypothetical protein
MKNTMFMRRSADFEIKRDVPKLTPIKIEQVKSVKIDKSKLIEILKEIRRIKETDTFSTLMKSTNGQSEYDFDDMILKLALMKTGFVPEKDNSVKVFNEMFIYYMFYNEIQIYLPYMMKLKK